MRGGVVRRLGGDGLARAVLGTAVGVLLAGAAGPARGCPPQLDALPEASNGIELGLGTTNSNAAIGSGRLTATLSRCGELTALKWPGPSYDDQLHYLTSNAPDARLLPHQGALDTMGAFAGLAYETRHGGAGFTWLRDPGWTHAQRYTSSTSDVVRTESRNAELGLEVVTLAFVLPDRDVLVEDLEVRLLPGSPVRRARALFYQNFAPVQTRLPYFPVTDTGFDFKDDYEAVYDAGRDALLHFAPSRRTSFGAIGAILADFPATPEALAEAVSGAVAGLDEPGVYLALGLRGGADGSQVGFDDAPICPHQSAIAERALQNLGFPPEFQAVARLLFVCDVVSTNPDGPLAGCFERQGWTYRAESAYRDAEDGVLSGSPLAACETNSALSKELVFDHRRAHATLYLAAAGTRDEAFALLDAARAPGTSPDEQRAATEAWWADFLAPARLPATDDPDVLRFSRRALASLRTATDAATGAIVASVVTQPPYGLDWPRDGAFLDYALDLAGYPEWVTRHAQFYVRVQRQRYEPWSVAFPFSCPTDPAARSYPDCVPPGSFEMNYYADPDAAVPGGPISFEIDGAGLALWGLWEHAGFLADPIERSGYLADICPALALGVTQLAACRDPETGLPCPANEDDNLPLTQNLQGAETVLLALHAGLEAADACGFPAKLPARWHRRAAELEAAILAHFLVAEPVPHFEGPRRAWIVWPARLRPYDDPLMRSHAEWNAERSLGPLLARQAPLAGYNSEDLIALAQLLRGVGDEAGLAALREPVRFLVHELTTPGTGHMAEFALRVDRDLDGDGDAPDYLPTNDVPHVWQQAYLYTAAMLVFGSREAGTPLPCDANGDGRLDGRDLRALVRSEGGAAPSLLDPRDPNEDGHIDGRDLRACSARVRAVVGPTGD
jgi:glucoamylase